MFVGLRFDRLAVQFPADMFGSYWDCGTEVIVNCCWALVARWFCVAPGSLQEHYMEGPHLLIGEIAVSIHWNTWSVGPWDLQNVQNVIVPSMSFIWEFWRTQFQSSRMLIDSLDWPKGRFLPDSPWCSWKNRWFPVSIFPRKPIRWYWLAEKNHLHGPRLRIFWWPICERSSLWCGRSQGGHSLELLPGLGCATATLEPLGLAGNH